MYEDIPKNNPKAYRIFCLNAYFDIPTTINITYELDISLKTCIENGALLPYTLKYIHNV